jgi:hypothetical protein
LIEPQSDHFTYDGRGVRVTSADAQFNQGLEESAPPRSRQYLYTPELHLMKRVTTSADANELGDVRLVRRPSSGADFGHRREPASSRMGSGNEVHALVHILATTTYAEA